MWAEWQTQNRKVDDDHHKLEGIVLSLRAVITTGGSPAIVAEAISVLRERMRLHFKMEEAVAGKADAETRAILKADHDQLLSMLDGMAAVSRQQGVDLRRLLEVFITASQRHEAEVDVPLFHMLSAHHADAR